MKALRIPTPGGPEVLRVEDVPDPTPPPGWLTLEVKAASINHLDLWVRRGLPMVKYPRIPGCDAAGIVRETGQRVLLDPATSCGTCEFCADGQKPMCRNYSVFGEHTDGTDAQFVMVGNRYGDGRALDFLLHDNMAAALSHLDKAVSHKNIAYLTARKYAQSTQPQPPDA